MSQLPVKFTVEFDDPQSDVLIPLYEERFYAGLWNKKNLKLINSAGFKSVDVSDFSDTMSKIIVLSKDEFDPPSVITVRLVIDNGVDPVYDVDLPMEKYLNYNVHRDHAAFIQELKVKSDSVTEISVEVWVLSFVPAPDPE